MSWNRNESTSVKTNKRSATRLHSFFVKSIVATFTVAGGTMAYLYFNTSSLSSTENKQEASKLIPSKKKALPKVTGQKAVPPVVKPLTPEEARKASEEDRLGNPHLVLDGNGTKWFRGAEVPIEKAGSARRRGKPWGHREYFKSIHDNILAKTFVHGLVTGPATVAQVPDDKFYQGLQASLSKEAELVGEQTDDAREIAKQLSDVKKLIAEKIASGETMKSIMAEAAKERDKIAAARKNYQDTYNEMMRKGASPEDLDDLVNAANSILKDNFAVPIRHNPLVAARLRKINREKKGTK